MTHHRPSVAYWVPSTCMAGAAGGDGTSNLSYWVEQGPPNLATLTYGHQLPEFLSQHVATWQLYNLWSLETPGVEGPTHYGRLPTPEGPLWLCPLSQTSVWTAGNNSYKVLPVKIKYLMVGNCLTSWQLITPAAGNIITESSGKSQKDFPVLEEPTRFVLESSILISTP